MYNSAFVGFEIPLELTNIWRYLHTAYAARIFRVSCPTDQEIIHYWGEYPNLPPLSAANRKKYSIKAAPFYTMTVPDTVKPAPIEDPTGEEPVAEQDATNSVGQQVAAIDDLHLSDVAANQESADSPAESPAEVENGLSVSAEPVDNNANFEMGDEATENSTSSEADNPKILAEAEVKDENRDSGNEEQSRDEGEVGENGDPTDTSQPVKRVTFMPAGESAEAS